LNFPLSHGSEQSELPSSSAVSVRLDAYAADLLVRPANALGLRSNR
jgi:hypothetical protein